ncbi:chorismate synthase [Treponema sp.]|uniref:chorismate synthase n=1 Tax=Treponema sp. TaxID=166 RepID=UPI003EFEEC42
MSGSTFGELFRVSTFGESHGAGLGCIIDGCPAGIDVDEEFLQHEMARRRPGAKGAAVTERKESDCAEILSGVFEGKTTGTPIAVLVRNSNQHSSDYDNIKNLFRPGHADFSYYKKYGIRDYRGGGRASGRETCARVAAGAFAKMFLRTQGIEIFAYTKEAAGIKGSKVDFSEIEKNLMRAADKDAAILMQKKVEEFKMSKNSCGGIVECVARGVPAGLGEPVFDKLDAVLSHAVMSIGAVKGIEFGSGFECADSTGLENNDFMESGFEFSTNNAGGILGGISRGDDIIFRAAIKPVPSIYLSQKTVDMNGNACDILIEGRHDVCLCPRIVPVVEAMTAIVLADMTLKNRCSRV